MKPMNRLFAIKYIFFGLILSVSLIASSFALVSFYEAKTLRLLKKETSDSELSWLNVSIDGTSVLVSGIAPNEASRFKAITLVSSIINSALITDKIEIKKDIILPKLNYTLELLRDDDEITLLGFLPEAINIEDVDGFNPDKYKFILKKENNGNSEIPVTTGDFVVKNLER